jgi:hypothetical protein
MDRGGRFYWFNPRQGSSVAVTGSSPGARPASFGPRGKDAAVERGAPRNQRASPFWLGKQATQSGECGHAVLERGGRVSVTERHDALFDQDPP